MIKNNNHLSNMYGTDIINMMNTCDKGHRHYCCNLNLTRPNYKKGYFNLLATALMLETFTWEDLLMHSTCREKVIKNYERNIAYYARRGEHVTLHKYATNYFNCYKTFFRNYGVLEQVKGKKRGVMQLTHIGKQLVIALYNLKH